MTLDYYKVKLKETAEKLSEFKKGILAVDESTTDWLKLKPFKLNAIVEIPKAVNQIPTTGHTAKKKCKARELLNEAYWKIKRPK